MQNKHIKGITLIALVITIIVLLILAGITIATLTGENGILNKAETAKEKHTIEQYREEITLIIAEEVAERKIDKKDELMIISLDKKIRQKEWVNEIHKCNSSGEEQQTFEESTHLLVKSKEHYEFLIEVNEAKETAKMVSNIKGTDEKDEPTTIKEAKQAGTILSTTQNKILTDDTGKSIVLPPNFKIDSESSENVSGGVVVEDSNQNEWVWIEVPKSIYSSTTTSTDHTAIETAMQNYAKDYRQEGFTDTFYSTAQNGFENETEYNNWKKSMLESVFTNGGFYIGRYEIGTDNTSVRNENSGISATPYIKQDMIPYNHITCSQAQAVSKQLSTSEKTSSLIFGVQWDLVLKFIEANGGKTRK